MKVLLLTVHYAPNLGGVETHLADLTNGLSALGHDLFVLCYRPLTNPVKWSMWERKNGVSVLRLPWFPGLFYKLVSHPAAEFLYLSPLLFAITPVVLLLHRPEVIHSHGLVAGFIAAFWGKIFRIKSVSTTHSVYSFPKSGPYRKLSKWIFDNSSSVLTLSRQSKREIEKLGVEKNKIRVFTYWIDLHLFAPVQNARKKLLLNREFVVLFVGRLVEIKGILVLIQSVLRLDPGVVLIIAGEGPLKAEIQVLAKKHRNIHFVGAIKQSELPVYYSAADVVVVPSLNEEGFGRVILESLACGTPVIATDKGATSEAMTNNVGRLISVSEESLSREIDHSRKMKLKEKLTRECSNFAQKRYSASNVGVILQAYESL